ncbi:MAG TPA: hypothetical protein VNT77_07795 [Allosphingosinicella sp.]|nr:hypothetical protein [Allosphingosinicella sp.]
MRLLASAFMVLLALGAAPAEPQVEPAQRAVPIKPFQQCDKLRARHAKDMGKAELKPLGKLPPGDLHLAVLREVNGCPEPAIVRHQIGAEPPRRQPEAPRNRARLRPL